MKNKELKPTSEELKAKIVELELCIDKQRSAFKTFMDCEKRSDALYKTKYDKEIYQVNERLKSLDSEIEMNSILTEEITLLKADLKQVFDWFETAKNEYMRERTLAIKLEAENARLKAELERYK